MKGISSAYFNRPVTVLKELLNNSINASPSNIYVEIDTRTGGCEYIRVKDDGCGIQPKDRSNICLPNSSKKMNIQVELQGPTHGNSSLPLLAGVCTQKGFIEITTRISTERVAEKWLINKDGSVKNGNFVKVSSPLGTIVFLRTPFSKGSFKFADKFYKPKDSIREIQDIISHLSLIHRNIKFHFLLITLNKNNSLKQKQIQPSIDTKLSRPRALALLGQSKGRASTIFIEENDLIINEFTKIDVILPKMSSEFGVFNANVSKKFLSVNNSIIAMNSGFGNKFNRLIDRIYYKIGQPKPLIWYINIKFTSNCLDLKLNARKNDIGIQDIDTILDQIQNSMLIYAEKGHLKSCETADDTYNSYSIGETNDDTITCLEVPKIYYKETTSFIEQEKELVSENNVINNFKQHLDTMNFQDNKNELTGKVIPLENANIQSHTPNTKEKQIYVPDLSVKCSERDSKRKLTSGSMVSDTGIWEDGVLCEPLAGTQPNCDQRSSSVPSSLTYDNKNSNTEYEDLELAKDASVSNPFIISKLRNTSKSKYEYGNILDGSNVGRNHNAHDNQLENITTPANNTLDLSFESTLGYDSLISSERKSRKLSMDSHTDYPLKLKHRKVQTFETELNINDTTLVEDEFNK